jgi:hypothetical protein
MSLSDDIKIFALQVEAWDKDVFDKVGQIALDSIVTGSPITGAPGQPVDTGVLKASWDRHYEDANTQLISSGGSDDKAAKYNMQNETGIALPGGGPYIQKSAVGGRHSVALTVAGFDKIVAAAVSGAA